MFLKKVLSFCALCLFGISLSADALAKSKQIVIQTNNTLQASQKKINKTDTQTTQMFDQYKTAKKEIKNYLIYNKQLQEIVSSQNEEISTLNDSIGSIEETGQQIMPFMAKMIDTLDSFVASDYPFLIDERKIRLQNLKDNMKRADISIAAKYRQILEAYQIEMEYGDTIESYVGEVDSKKVSFLKIGRVGLYYLSFDKTSCWAWSQKDSEWKFLQDSEYKLSIAKAIKIAKKQKSPDLFFAAVAPARSRK